MDLHNLLQDVEIFNGLTETELAVISQICQERLVNSGETITKQGEPGGEMYIITEGFVQVSIGSGSKERILVNLGAQESLNARLIVKAFVVDVDTKYPALGPPYSDTCVKRIEALSLRNGGDGAILSSPYCPMSPGPQRALIGDFDPVGQPLYAAVLLNLSKESMLTALVVLWGKRDGWTDPLPVFHGFHGLDKSLRC